MFHIWLKKRTISNAKLVFGSLAINKYDCRKFHFQYFLSRCISHKSPDLEWFSQSRRVFLDCFLNEWWFIDEVKFGSRIHAKPVENHWSRYLKGCKTMFYSCSYGKAYHVREITKMSFTIQTIGNHVVYMNILYTNAHVNHFLLCLRAMIVTLLPYCLCRLSVQ